MRLVRRTNFFRLEHNVFATLCLLWQRDNQLSAHFYVHLYRFLSFSFVGVGLMLGLKLEILVRRSEEHLPVKRSVRLRMRDQCQETLT